MTKKEEKKERILDVAVAVFSQEGFYNTKITKIAELSGIASGSIYLYFNNKEEILIEIFYRTWFRISARVNEIVTDSRIDNLSKIKQIALYLTERIYEDRNVAILILQEHRFWNSEQNTKLYKVVRETFSIIRQIIVAGMQSGEFRSTLISSVATSYLIGGVWNLLEYWAHNFDEISYDIIKIQVSELVERTLK